MSAESPSQRVQPTPPVTCPVCGTIDPPGAFCVSCGAHLSRQRGNGPDWMRVRAYAGAPGEHLLRMSAVSSVFPHLPHRSRAAFRAGLAVLVVLLVALALLRWQAALIAVTALGVPLLFLIYLEESDVYHHLPVRALVLTGVIGAGLGVGWAVLTGPIVARSYTAGSGLGSTGAHVLRDGLAIPAGGAVLMLVPAVLVRLLRPPTRESLDGYLIGSLGAIAYTAAAILTRLTPQLATGPIASGRPVAGLCVEAGIQGVAMPLTAASAGGLVGAALWYTRRADPPRRGVSWSAVVPAAVVVLAVYAGLGFADITPLPPGLQLAVHLMIAAAAILALRIALHLGLLHEAHEAMRGEPLLCTNCHHVVPDMAFCANCGAALRAASRSSREARRVVHPVQAEPTSQTTPGPPPSGPAWTGYAVPAPSYTAAAARHTSHTRLFVILGAALAVVAAAVVVVSWSITPPPAPRSNCPPFCGGPPTGPPGAAPTPVGAPPSAAPSAAPAPPGGEPPAAGQAAVPPVLPGPPAQAFPRRTFDGGFTLAYPGIATIAKDGWTMSLAGGQALLYGEPAGNRTPIQIAQNTIQQRLRGATIAYQIPNAMVGYQPGYGEIDDYYLQNPNSKSIRLRVLAMAAVKNGLALIAFAVGPYVEHTDGHPSGANLEIADTMGYFVNSFRWPGDPPR